MEDPALQQFSPVIPAALLAHNEILEGNVGKIKRNIVQMNNDLKKKINGKLIKPKKSQQKSEKKPFTAFQVSVSNSTSENVNIEVHLKNATTENGETKKNQTDDCSHEDEDQHAKMTTDELMRHIQLCHPIPPPPPPPPPSTPPPASAALTPGPALTAQTGIKQNSATQ